MSITHQTQDSLHTDPFEKLSFRQKLRQKMSIISRYCVVLIAFSIPISTLFTQIALALFMIHWLISHNIRQEFKYIFNHPITRVVLSFFAVIFLGMCFSQAPLCDSTASLHKMSKILYIVFLLPILHEPLWRTRALNAFLAAMGLTLILGYLKLYTPLPFPIRYTAACIFKNHIDTNLMMSFACYFLAHRLLMDPLKYFMKILGWLGVGLMSFYIFWMSEGRSGYIIFASLWMLFILQHIRILPFRYTMLGLLALGILLMSVLGSSARFQKRLEHAVMDVARYQTGETQTSIGSRLEFITETFRLGMRHPWFGHGTGSFKQDYATHAAHSGLTPTQNPHNEYANIFYQTGFLGLSLWLWFLLKSTYLSFKLPMFERRLIQGLLFSMAIGCLANSWLMDFTSGHFFVLIAAACLAAYSPGNKSEKSFSL